MNDWILKAEATRDACAIEAKKLEKTDPIAARRCRCTVEGIDYCLSEYEAWSQAEYPQSPEDDEYRYLDPNWMDALAAGLTAGAKKHPGATWRTIPADEHAARALRHLNNYRTGDRSEDHLLNASMRCMMAYVVDKSTNK